MQETMIEALRDELESMKAIDLVMLDVQEKTVVTDWVMVMSGTSTRHVKTLANTVVEFAKEHGVEVLGIEGEDNACWILVDLADVVLHIMLPEERAFYQLEKLWSMAED